MHQQLKAVYSKAIKESFADDKVCLLLSGGTDSIYVGLLAAELGKKIDALSYRLEGYASWDFSTAERVCAELGWNFHEVIVPMSNAKADFLSLTQDDGCSRKTEVEVLFPFKHLLKKAKSLGYDQLLTGFSSPLPASRKSSTLIRQSVEEYWNNAFNRDFDNPATQKCFEYAAKQGVKLEQPLLSKPAHHLMKDLSWSEVHKPYWKAPFKLGFKETFEQIGLLNIRNTIPLQVGGSVEEYFLPLLSDQSVNLKNYQQGTARFRLGLLASMWSKNPKPTSKKSSKKQQFQLQLQLQSYTLADVKKASKRADFTVVTTFAGGGGSSTGYRLGGGKILLANEFVPEAVATYHANYPETPIAPMDIRKVTRAGGRQKVLDWFKTFGIEEGEYDILDGSPPCATFSTMSGGKGSDKMEKKNVAYSDVSQDRIGMLIHDYVYMANCTKPRVCVIENVPSIKSSPVFHHALDRLRKWGYKVNFSDMTSSNFGVSQRRKRLIAIAVRPDICKKVGIKNDQDILEIYPSPSSHEPNLRDALTGIEIDKLERNLLLTSAIKSATYEIIKAIPKNPPKPMTMADIRTDWTSDFGTSRASWHHPCPTLTQRGQQSSMAGIYHPDEDRVFTTSELKRLMGLPDDFILTGTFDQKAERCCRMVTPPLYKHLSEAIYQKVLLPARNN